MLGSPTPVGAGAALLVVTRPAGSDESAGLPAPRQAGLAAPLDETGTTHSTLTAGQA